MYNKAYLRSSFRRGVECLKREENRGSPNNTRDWRAHKCSSLASSTRRPLDISGDYGQIVLRKYITFHHGNECNCHLTNKKLQEAIAGSVNV